MNSLFMIINLLSMYKVVWTNTVIEIPLNDNTHQYYDMPQASLYCDGVLITDELFYYEKGINRTSLTVINSNHIKEFRVDYAVDFYELGLYFEQTITYRIVDNIAPEVIKVPTFRFPVNTKIPTDKILLEDLYYKDNYYEEKDIVVRINNLSNININIPGIYLIEFELMDLSFNTVKITTTYEVFDNNLPTIKYTDPIIHHYGISFDHYKYFKYVGNDLSIEVDDSKINYNLLGTYPITIKATNSSNLSQTISTTITIVDNIKPEITLKSNIMALNVGSELSEHLLSSYILSVSDNYDSLTTNDVVVVYDIDINIVGKYIIRYTISDSSNNKFTISTNIEVKDLIKPDIRIIDDLIFNVSEENPYWANYFSISDNYDHLDDLKIVFNDKNINFNNLGDYYLVVEVTDTAKNKAIQTYKVEIKDLLPPTVEVVDDIYIYDFIKGDDEFFKTHFKIEDNWSKYNDITIVIKDDMVDYSKIGENEIEIIFIDKSGNETHTNINIYLLDVYPPIIEVGKDILIYFIGSSKPDLYSNILTVSDNFDDLGIEDVLVKNNIDYNNTGKYEVTYELTDKSYNETIIVVDFYVDKYKSELITGRDIFLEQNDYWNELDGIILSEEVSNYEIFYKHFDTSEPLITTILYVAYDQRGNSETYEQKIEIKSAINNNKTLIQKYFNIAILTVVFGVVVIIVIYYNKKKKTY